MPWEFEDSTPAASQSLSAAKSARETKSPWVFEEQESTLSNIGRQAGRTGARIVETALGAPRAIGEFAESIVPEKAIKYGAEKVGLGEGVAKGIELVKKYAPYKAFPSSEQIRENVTKRVLGKGSEPKNEWERKADEAVSDFTALALPLPGSQLKVLKPLLLSLGGNIASDIVGRMGGSEKQKTYSKLGTIFLGSLVNPNGAKKLGSELYDQARKALPENATVSSVKLERSLDTLEKELKKGGVAGSDKTALQKIADVRGEMQGAQIPVEALDRAKVKINEARAGLYKELEGNRPGIKSAKRNLDMVKKTVDEALNTYGKQNPEWGTPYKAANEVYGAIAQSQKARDYIVKIAKKYGGHSILPALGIGHVAGPATALKTIGAAAVPSIAGFMAGELGVRIAKSPTLRKHYAGLIKAAIKEDVVATHQNLEKLEKELEKED